MLFMQSWIEQELILKRKQWINLDLWKITSLFIYNFCNINFYSKLVMNGTWKQPGVYNLEELDPDPFMEALNEYGLPWVVVENPQMVD